MHSSSSAVDTAAAIGAVEVIVFIALLVCYIIAWYMAMKLISKSAEAKGQSSITIRDLWFIGLFATPITPSLIVSILPDKSQSAGTKAIEDDLPAI